MVPCKGTAEKVSFEWSHHRISSTDSKVRTTLHVHVSIIYFGRERVGEHIKFYILNICGAAVLSYFFQRYVTRVNLILHDLHTPKNCFLLF